MSGVKEVKRATDLSSAKRDKSGVKEDKRVSDLSSVKEDTVIGPLT